MKECRYCKNLIDDDSLFCKYCGEKLTRSKSKKIRIPKPIQLDNGEYSAQVMVDGVRHRVHGYTLQQYEVNARALKSGIAEAKKKPFSITLGAAVDSYIDSVRNVLSPSTIMGYRSVRRNRFKRYMDKRIDGIKWQNMVNEEAKTVSPKTLANAWNLVSPALAAISFPVPQVNLPQCPVRDLHFLDYQQIEAFLMAIKGHTGELAAILALHSLRMSELIAVTVDDVVDGFIRVNKAIVPDENYKPTERDVNKTYYSTRQIPVVIPRLYELLPESGKLVTIVPVTIEKAISDACIRAGLPHITPHDLRRTFASLAYHLHWQERSVMKYGGWSNMNTVHRIYIKLSQHDLDDDVEKMREYYKFT